MADKHQLGLIEEGVDVWNNWRNEQPEIRINLSHANFSGKNLSGTNFKGADLSECTFVGADVSGCDFRGAELYQANFVLANLSKSNFSGGTLLRVDLTKAKLCSCDLSVATLNFSNLSQSDLRDSNLNDTDLFKVTLIGADLSGAILTQADLEGANLNDANFSYCDLWGSSLSYAHCHGTNFYNANLSHVDLQGASLVDTNLQDAVLRNCRVYGLSAWNLKGKPAYQGNFVITPKHEASISVDNLEVAQFIYLLLNRENLRNVITTITSKMVLILGRFTPERKLILEAIAGELRKRRLLPIIFDFERPASRDFTETISTLAGLSLFVIVDITNPKSSPVELHATVPNYQIPFVPIIQEGEEPFSMFTDFAKYDWVLPLITYPSVKLLLEGFEGGIMVRALNKLEEIREKISKEHTPISITNYLE